MLINYFCHQVRLRCFVTSVKRAAK